MAPPIIQLRGVTKTFAGAAGACTALDHISLDIDPAQLTAVVGASGSGKSTLLALLSGIDRPTSGDLTIAGSAIGGMTERSLTTWRGRTVGIVFQFFQLLPTLSAAENVMLAMDFVRVYPARERRDRAMTLLERLGVTDQAHKLPATMSGGQQQRVAVARAMANGPALLLADEPTGNLDSKTATSLLELFAGLVRDGQTIVMVTHDAHARDFASRVVELVDGRLVNETASG